MPNNKIITQGYGDGPHQIVTQGYGALAGVIIAFARAVLRVRSSIATLLTVRSSIDD